MNKKAIQLSMNFIVVLILAIVVFGFSIFFLKSIFTSVIDIHEMTADELTEQVGFLSCGNEPACLETDKLEIERTEHEVFGVMINNYRNEKIKLWVTVEGNNVVNDNKALDPKGNLNLLFGIGTDNKREFILEPNEEKKLGILVEAKKTAASDTYLLNVKTQYCILSTDTCNPNVDFGNGLYKLYVTVP